MSSKISNFYSNAIITKISKSLLKDYINGTTTAAQRLYDNAALNKKYDIDYFSDDHFIIIKYVDIYTLIKIGGVFKRDKLIQHGYVVSYASLNNYPELNYYINDKIGVSINSGVITDIYKLFF